MPITWLRFKSLITLTVSFIAGCSVAIAQSGTRTIWHDLEKKHVKEIYQLKDTVRNILHGRYISYYLNGNIESKGQFTNNETTGVWEFFYETGNLKMRGILRQNANYGVWEYFYESGQKSMEGNINGPNREGEWKMYYENGQIKEIGEYEHNKRIGIWKSNFEDGALRGECDYTDDFGTYTEYYHDGKVFCEGPKSGVKNVGHWRYFADDGSLQAEGGYQNGKKHGTWTTYYAGGPIASKGKYEQDQPVGTWEYYFDDGKLSSSGEFLSGVKTGTWTTLHREGTTKSEIVYTKGNGQYREYYTTGKLKVKGRIVNNKKEGTWEYFYEDGKSEGMCEYSNDKGTYVGYYPNGSVRTKGTIEGDQKTGTWEMYETDGKLSGYYRPFYDDRKLGKEIESLSRSGNKALKSGSSAKRLTHFDARFNEFRGVIIGTNPVMVFAGRLPVGVEFYLQERLGHEFEFVGMRDPFFRSDSSVPVGKQFDRGYSITIRQKLYNQVKAGMWYFGQEIRFTNVGHFVNELSPTPGIIFTAAAVEQRIEYGLVLGYRIMKRNNMRGFTIDAFMSGDAGYRGFDVDPNYESYFEDIKQSRFVTSLHFGLNFGKVFSYR